MLLSWLRSRRRRPTAAARSRTARPTFRPCLEALEHRINPGAHTWNPAAVSGSWANAANWSVGGAPAPGETNVQLTFDISGQTNVTNDVANLTFQTITYNAAAPAYTLHLDTATQNVQAGGLTITNNSAATETINGAQALNTAAGADLIVTGSGNVMIGQLIAGAGGLTQNGTGTLTLTNAGNTYTGATTVPAGVLAVTGSTSTSVTNVTGGTLTGTGTVRNIVATGGTVDPGSVGAVGTLTSAGTATSTFNGATFRVDVNGLTADRLTQTAGTVDLTGATLNLNIIAAGPVGTTYTILSSGTVTGRFTNAPAATNYITIGSDVYQVTYILNRVDLTRANAKQWTGASGVDNRWSTGTNWLGGVAPGSGDTVIFDTTTPGFNATPAGAGFNPNNDIGGLANLVIAINDSSAAGDFTITGNGFNIGNITSTVSNGVNATIDLGANILSALLSGTSINSTTTAPLVINNPVQIGNAGFNPSFNGPGNMILNGVVSSGTGALLKAGGGILTLANTANTFNGAVLGTGITTVASLASGGTPSSLGSGTSVTVANAGTLQYTGTTAQLTDYIVGLNAGGGGTIDASGSGAAATVSFTNPGLIAVPFAAGGPRTLTLTGSNTGNNMFAPLVHNGAGTAVVSLTKSGSGTWVLTNANTFTGATTITAGALEVDGTDSSSPVSLTGGTLQGSGTVQSIAATGGTVSPGMGGGGAIGTLTTAAGGFNTTLNGATFQIDVNNPGASDQLVIGAGATLDLTGAKLSVNVLGSATSNMYTILSSASGGISNTFVGLPDLANFTAGGRIFQIHYTANAVTLTDVGAAPVPVPPPSPLAPPTIFAVGAGSNSEVKVYNGDGSLRLDFFAYGPPAPAPGAGQVPVLSDAAGAPPPVGGVRVAVGDVNGDGFPDIITGSGPGRLAEVKVFNGLDSQMLYDFFPTFDNPLFTGGIFVAAGDVNGDGFADMIVGEDAGGLPQVQVFGGGVLSGAKIRDFFAYATSFSGGVRVGAGDVNGDGFADIITGTGPGGGSRVRVFDGKTTVQLQDYFAFGPDVDGINVAGGRFSGSGLAGVLVGADSGAPLLKSFASNESVLSYFVAAVPGSGGVRVGSEDVAGRSNLVLGTGPGGLPLVQVLDALSLAVLDNFYAFGSGSMSGVYVG